MKRFFSVLAAGMAAFLTGSAPAQPNAQPAEPERMLPSELDFAYVRLNTSKGAIVLELDNKKAPISTANFVMYVEDGHYDDTLFHRVMNDPRLYVIQGGGFDTELNQKAPRAPIRNEWRNGLKNTRGTISMARVGMYPDSATSQFFINANDNPFLDSPRDGAGYAVFGRVISGMEVVDAIRTSPTHTLNRTVEQVDPATGEVARIPANMENIPVEPIVVREAVRVDPESISELIAAARAAEETANAAARAAEEAARKAEEQRRVTLSSMDAGLQWLVDNHGVDPSSVTKHESGLWSVIATSGDGSRTPAPTDRVTVHYTGWLTDGTKFDSSRDRGQPITFPLSGVIKGWTEGVGYMSPGETRYLIIPGDLGYGVRGSPPRIPGNAVLIFDVQLIEIPA